MKQKQKKIVATKDKKNLTFEKKVNAIFFTCPNRETWSLVEQIACWIVIPSTQVSLTWAQANHKFPMLGLKLFFSTDRQRVSDGEQEKQFVTDQYNIAISQLSTS